MFDFDDHHFIQLYFVWGSIITVWIVVSMRVQLINNVLKFNINIFIDLFVCLKLDIDESEENCRDSAVDD